jgi:tripartite-type tricarboxylate transporter receptor subunit TctC
VTDTPILKDMVPYSWYALVGQPKLPQDIVRKLSEASAKVAAMPDYVTMQQNAGVIPGSSTPAQLRATTDKEIAKWREVGKTVKIAF